MSTTTSNELHHSGRKGMKWGMNIFGRRQPKGTGRVKRGTKPEQQNVKMPKKVRRSVDERLREDQFRDMYRTRDNLSTKALKSKIARLEAEQRFKQLVEAPEKARLETIQKKKQARLAFIGKVGSAALDVYSKAPSSIAGRNLSGQAAKDAIEVFKKRQEWAKAFKDVPTTMTKFTQSGVTMGEIINGVYIPSQDELLLHYGKKGMKWKKNRQDMMPAEAAFSDAEEHEENHDYGKDAEKYKKDARYYEQKVKGGIEKGKARNKKEQKYPDKHNDAMNKYIDASERKKNQKNLRKKVKHSDISEDTLLHYGKKGMKWKKLRAQLNEGEEQGVGVIGGATVGIGHALNADYLMKKRYEEIDKRDKFNAAAKATKRKADKKKYKDAANKMQKSIDDKKKRINHISERIYGLGKWLD